MPIPQRKDNEKQGDYMGRCMEFMKDEKYPQKQKVAICLNTFNTPKKKTKGHSVEIDFSDKIKEMKEKKAQELVKQQEPVKIEEPKVEVKVEPTHNAVTAPAEPIAEAPIVETPKVETPVVEAPKVEAPVAATPESTKK